MRNCCKIASNFFCRFVCFSALMTMTGQQQIKVLVHSQIQPVDGLVMQSQGNGL